MKHYLLCTFLFSLLSLSVVSQQRTLSIVPEPAELIRGKGSFLLDAKTIIVAENNDAGLRHLAETFTGWLSPATGFQLKIADHAVTSVKSIELSLNASIKDIKTEEGYLLEISSNRIHLSAAKPAGIFYGLQTLRQLLPPAIEYQSKQAVVWEIPAVKITDYPRFGWRGLLLDVSRHFFTKEFVKKYVDEMARYKFNILHLHLTDDQGWRIQIKSFPGLTETGAWRVPRTGRWWTYEQPKPGEAATYGGFYTQDDIREMVQYARERNVAILPEIDVPGHSLAAIASYPYLSATGYLYPVNPGSKFYNIEDNTLNPADERVYDFLDKVFGEIAQLFPYPYIHIGGDECTKTFWKKSAVVQDFMKKEGIKSEHELQSYFIKRLETILKQKGKKLIGWDEILEGGLAPDATVMSWRGMSGGVEAAKQGHNVVMTPADNVYLDLYQGDPATEPDTYSMLRLKTCYQWDPVPRDVKPSLILGGQGNLWTESVPTDRHAEYMTWPRALALSEVFWSPVQKQQWPDFQNKLEAQFHHLRAAGINYSRAAYDVLATTTAKDNKQLFAELTTDIDSLTIYYTIDNTNPDNFSNEYKGQPIQIPEGIYQLRAVAYKDNAPAGNILILSREDLEKRARHK
ncbi:MAG: family 20 glycosylhydrolase [Sphingobacteriales bacterium]|nr:family 20 glycosylhydrolase [Sphingobacteriales bacterium]OJY85584.1 MAG: beta-N-acetylhexosaminidase [Sphingobacteriales bacterium 44-15]